MISEFGSPDTHAKYLPGLLTMADFASYCLTEPNAGSDAASLSTSARRTEEGWILNGSKAFISGGSASNVYVVMARSDPQDKGPKGISCFVVDGDAEGLSFGAQEKKLVRGLSLLMCTAFFLIPLGSYSEVFSSVSYVLKTLSRRAPSYVLLPHGSRIL
jgi:alkylation response protein AidB-like acyl-CoA dehydrogenase